MGDLMPSKMLLILRIKDIIVHDLYVEAMLHNKKIFVMLFVIDMCKHSKKQN